MGQRKRLKSLAFVTKVTRRDLPVTLHHRRVNRTRKRVKYRCGLDVVSLLHI